MDFAEHRIATEDGPRVGAYDYAADAVHRLPVVCLHGLTRNAADFEAVAPRNATRGRRVIGIDARGRGKSDNDPQPARYRPDTYVGDVVRVLDTLNVPRAVFLGTSMGGIMTMIAAVMAPTRIAAAILNDIGPEVDPKGHRAHRLVCRQPSGPFGSWAEMIAAVKASQGAMFPHGDDAFWRTFAQRVARERDDGGVEFACSPAIAQAFAAPPACAAAEHAAAVRGFGARAGARGARRHQRHPGGRRRRDDAAHRSPTSSMPRCPISATRPPWKSTRSTWDAIAQFLANVE